MLSVEEFVQRWSEHVPLSGLRMVRAWGLYASTQRPKLERCREQLPEAEPVRGPAVAVPAEPDHNHPRERCPGCGQPSVVTQVLPRAGAPPPHLPLAHAA